MSLSKISVHSCMIILMSWKKIFLSLLFASFQNSKKKLKYLIEDCFKINGKLTTKMPIKGEHITFKNFGRKIKSAFMIYADFESILVQEDNGKQKPNESYTNKY